MPNGRSLWLEANSIADSPIFEQDIDVQRFTDGGIVVGFKVQNGGETYTVSLRTAPTPGWVMGTWRTPDDEGKCQARYFVGGTGLSLQGTWTEAGHSYDWIVLLPHIEES